MFLNWQAFLILIMAVSTITATKCGKYECHDNTECTFDEEKKEMKCICPKDFTTTFGDNNVYCCQKEDTKCGPNHQCNKELQCKDLTEEIEIPMNSETVECDNGEQKCQDKCCAANEICQEGKACVAKEVENENCPLARQCNETCCKENELCSMDKECVENLSSEAEGMCSVEKQCNEKCCAENEICSATKECVTKANVSCPAESQCAEKCCKANESCSKDKECIEKADMCPLERQCNGTCCNQNEICSESKICIDQHNICPEARQCLEKCCSEEEICTEDKECLNKVLAICSKEKRCNNKICCDKDELCWENLGCANKTNCDDSRKCLEKCCHANEICNEHFECIDCPLKQQCNGKCCADNEICFESECYEVSLNDNINMPECPKQLQCGEICCDSNDICSEDFKCLKQQCLKCGEFCCKDQEICSEALECKPNIPAYADCPLTQQCNGKCCARNEICTESKACECPELQKCHGKQCCSRDETCHVNECVNKNLLSLLGLYDFPKQKLSNDLNDVVELYDCENSNTKRTQCPVDHAPCQELCCQPHQFCNTLAQCEENPVATWDDDGEPYADTTHVGYHFIGIGCLVFAVGFSLFKIICACIQSQQYVLK